MLVSGRHYCMPPYMPQALFSADILIIVSGRYVVLSVCSKMGRSSKPRARRRRNKLTRSRPHPEDHPFSGVFPFTDTPGTKLVLFALAMCWEHPKDRLRLQMVLNTYPATRVISTSWSQRTCGSMQHCECNFGDRKGLRTLGVRIKVEREEHPSAVITVALDWNWLHVHYYDENYRLHNWFDGGIKLLLDAGADKIMLPYDGGVRHEGYSCMANALSKSDRMLDSIFHSSNLATIHCGLHLVVCTSRENSQAIRGGTMRLIRGTSCTPKLHLCCSLRPPLPCPVPNY